MIEIRKNVNLDNLVQVESLHGVTFSNENKGHKFIVSCMSGGELLTLTGTVTARFMRSNNTTILIAGNNYTGIADGKVVVTLPQDCYNVPGRFQMAIFLTDDGATSCIYACVGSVQRTQEGTLIDSGDAVPTLTELLAQIDACEQATADATAAASAANAAAESASTAGESKFIRYDAVQSLTANQQAQARANIGASTGAVLYSEDQTLTDAQKTVARNNTGSASATDVDDIKSAIDSMTTATAEDEGKALKAKTVSGGKVTEWEFGEASGIVTPEDISMAAVEQETECEIDFEDGQYVSSYYNKNSNANMSITTTDIPAGAKTITYTTYQQPTHDVSKGQFLLDNGDVAIENAISYSQVSRLLYIVVCNVPERAISFRSTIYTSEKSNAFIKVKSDMRFVPEWIELPDGIVSKEAIYAKTDSVKDNVSVTYEDGYGTFYGGTLQQFPYNFSNHQPNPTLSTAILSGVLPLTLYEIDSYYSVAMSPGGIVVWYDADGVRIVDDNGNPYNFVIGSNRVQSNNNHYRQIVMSPLRAAMAKIVIALDNKNDCEFKKITPNTKALEWLSVGIRNLDPLCLDLISDNVLNILDETKYDYSTIVDRTISVRNKTAVLFGDSIAAGVASGTTDSNFKTWANIFKTRTGITLSNQAVSAKCITNNDNDSNSISAKAIAYTGDANIIMVAGGTNDHTNEKPLGAWGDTTVVTFYGALHAMCEHFKTLSAEKVVFVTPINKSQRYKNTVSLDKYREAIQITARQYGFDVIEGKEFGFPDGGGVAQTLFLPDNLHPSQSGHVMYANEVCCRLV